MASEDLTSFAALLKEWYTPKQVATLTYTNCPALAMIPKNTSVSGETLDVPLIYGDGGGSSATFSTAVTNKSSTTSAKFQVPMADEYSLGSIARKLIKASRDDKGAFMKGAKVQIDAAFRRSRNAMGINIFNDGTPVRGTAASASSQVVTMTSKADCTKFHEGLVCQVWDDSAGAFLTGTYEVTAVNHADLEVTFGGSFSAAVASGDLFIRAGDAGGDPSDIANSNVLTGFGAYITTSTSPAALHGLTRTADVSKLSGVKYSATTETIYEGLVNAQSEAYTIGDGAPDTVFLHPDKFRDLLKELSNKVQLQRFNVNERIGFQGFEIQGNAGVMRVFADRYCPVDKAYLLELDTWELASLGPTLDIFDKDSDQEMLREASNDAYEVRVGSYSNLVCHAPGHNAVCYWSA